MNKYVLGISAFYHDSAAVLLKDGQIVFAAQEERFTRKKHDASFPINAIKAALDRAQTREGKGPGLASVEAVAFYDKPFLKFERLLETYYAYAPRGAAQFRASTPGWIKEKLLLKSLIRRELGKLDPAARDIKLLFPEHHLSHAASAFYPSPYANAAILTVDGVGEWATASICGGKGSEITILKELRFPHSLGLLYSAFTYYAGFKVNSGEYKLMGLAPYGEAGSARTAGYVRKIKETLVDIKEDGSLWLNQDYFDYAAGLKMCRDEKWAKLFGIPPRTGEDDPAPEYCDLALAIQQVTEEVVLKMAASAMRLAGSRNLCLAGGVALNCVANGKLLFSKACEGLWVQPAAGDAGGALGAALAAWHIYFGEPRALLSPDAMAGASLGPDFTDTEAETFARSAGAVYEKLDDKDLYARAAALLASGAALGWFQGRMEWGPRALGNRSILGDARSPELQRTLNLKIKHRESFRPFAPSVREEDAAAFFEGGLPSPYMLSIDYLRPDRRLPEPAGYSGLGLKEKLYHLRSGVPAITHVDYSARAQTVSRNANPRYHALLTAFKELTGCGLLANTSFNVRGEPIVCTPEDAYRCFMGTGLDYLVIGNLLFDKTRQPVPVAGTGGAKGRQDA